MTEVLFYHLTEHTLQGALPGLLERCLARDWKVVVQTATPELRDALNDHLWTYRADSFLPHAAGEGGEEGAEEHPVWLTTSTDNPNGAQVRFVVEGAVPGPIETYVRVIHMFDGRDEDAVVQARERWKIDRDAGHDLTYWQQNEEGRWSKRG